ncbi:hypothetical protein RSOL_437790 [Rhizoctonia solani AG-3 Rhs1AP]|uniref:Uncharacterized protein n=1 Tax=Rhizoctonia solani AG-3 Rhs1AP TaxID=1086054 RepID=X8JKR5_9AGAM|nr:hypothetical protein RSOL_437790 [Rhizoctonia solani AG-3 Rhs1AP]
MAPRRNRAPVSGDEGEDNRPSQASNAVNRDTPNHSQGGGRKQTRTELQDELDEARRQAYTNALFQPDIANTVKSAISDLEAEEDASTDGDRSTPERECLNPMQDFWNTPRFNIAPATEIVRELISHMDLNLAKRWLEPWFQKEMPDEMFGQRGQERKRAGGAKDLLKDDNYLWANIDESDPRSEFEQFFRSHCILQSTKLILLGASSINSDHRSAQAGASRANQYGLKHITPSILSFIAIAVHFVLSGDKAFDKVTATTNYVDLYEANMRLLKAHQHRYRTEYNEMIDMYNHSIFPDFHKPDEDVEPETAGMTSGRKSFYEKLLQAPIQESSSRSQRSRSSSRSSSSEEDE